MSDFFSEQIKGVEEDIRARESWQNVFRPSSPGLAEDARYVLAAIAVECGVHETEPARIKPDRISLWNWIQHQLGIIAEDSMMQLGALLTTANNEDLQRVKAQLQRQQEEADDARE